MPEARYPGPGVKRKPGSPSDDGARERIQGFCAMCVSRCGSVAVVEGGRFVALEPDPNHPTGRALCAKGRAAPELVYHPERLLHPLKRTRPKGDSDPGWQRIGWDEALDLTARRLREIAEQDGPESVVFGIASPSTTASADALIWIERLRRAFGSPNEAVSMELCGWGRYGAPIYTWGASVPGAYLPDLERTGCMLFWGYNPSVARIAHAVAATRALRRGARLVVVDPRRAGLAHKADEWLRVRPGTDGALALGLAHVMIERGWYDRAFVRSWTNGPLLVREDDGRLLRASEVPGLDPAPGSEGRYVVWSEAAAAPAVYDPATGAWRRQGGRTPQPDARTVQPALLGRFELPTAEALVPCRTVFQRVADLCGAYPPVRVEALSGVPAAQVEATARLLWEARPVSFYAWSGVEMQSSATQIARAIGQLYALTGSFDGPGGNVRFGAVPTEPVDGQELPGADRRAPALGTRARPLGPARFEHVTSDEIYTAVLEHRPYPVRGLVGFGANLLMAHADGRRGREALRALDFYVHADLFMTPTAELADVVLPVASAFEREALQVGFETSEEAQAWVQLRQPVVEPRGEARSDIDIVFDLACRLGLGEHFWNGDVETAYRHRLGPSGISLEALRANPGGLRHPVQTRHRKHAEMTGDGPVGFSTPTRKIELYSETLLRHGHPPLPDYEEPLVGPERRPDLARRYPLVLTCAKHALFCESQHRGLPSLRRRAPDPEVEIHPLAAGARGIAEGDWVRIETPRGSVRARARFDGDLAPGVVCGQHGWWQACPSIGAPGYAPLGADGANLNAIIGHEAVDPVSGSVPHRAYLCEIRREITHLEGAREPGRSG